MNGSFATLLVFWYTVYGCWKDSAMLTFALALAMALGEMGNFPIKLDIMRMFLPSLPPRTDVGAPRLTELQGLPLFGCGAEIMESVRILFDMTLSRNEGRRSFGLSRTSSCGC